MVGSGIILPHLSCVLSAKYSNLSVLHPISSSIKGGTVTVPASLIIRRNELVNICQWFGIVSGTEETHSSRQLLPSS